MRLAQVCEIYHVKSREYGSGYVLAPGLILTARHVVIPEGWEARIGVREPYRVRLVGDAGSPRPPWRNTALLWWSPLHDVALLGSVTSLATAALPTFGRIPREGRAVACRAVGFPSATERADENDTHDLGGEIRPGGGVVAGALWVDVKTAPPAKPDKWAGISGAALFCGDVLVGVIASYPTEFAGRVLKATPLDALTDDAGFCEVLGRACPLSFVDVSGSGRLVPPGLPPAPRLFGRQERLAELITSLLAYDPRPILLHGGPGIGKTSLALAALHHPDVIAWFGERRLFLRLEAASNGAAVLAALGAALGLSEGPDLPARALRTLAELRSLVILDNLETPWAADGAGTQEALDQCAAVRSARILATIRGSERPGRLRWQVLAEVRPLDPAAARALFVDVAGEAHARDPALPELLEALGWVPLAVELMAKRIEDAGDATSLLQLWRTKRTAVARVGAGGHKDLDLAASIELSLASPRMGEASRRLVALMGRLPDGLVHTDCEVLLGADAFEAVAGLVRTGLAYREGGRLRMLVPVREHAAGTMLDQADDAVLVDHFLKLADGLPQAGESPAEPALALQARGEIGNIEALLEGAMVKESTALAAGGLASAARLRELAVLSVKLADTRQLMGGLTLAMQAYKRAHGIFTTLATLDPAYPVWQYDLSLSWNRIGDVRRTQGDLPGALRAYEDALAIAERLAAADSANPEFQHDLSVSWSKIGDVRRAQGDLPGALRAYEDNRAITQRLAAADPANAGWQRDLSISWQRIGDVRWVQGDLPGALRNYEDAQAIAERLGAAAPTNAEWQDGLSIIWERIGHVRWAQNDPPGALRAFEESRAIREPLAAADPANTGWQRGLSIIWERIGDVRLAQGDLLGALRAYEDDRGIAERLAAADPANAEWQRDLSISWNRIGDVRLTQKDFPGALRAFEDALAIAERLAAATPTNAEWQHDLAVSWERIGDVRQAQGDLPGALRAYEDAGAIRERLAVAAPTNAEWQRGLWIIWERIGDVRRGHGDLPGALCAYEDARAIVERLAAAAPTNAEWQHDLAVTWERIGGVRRAQGDLPGALRAYEDAWTIVERLAAAAPTNAEWQHDLAVTWERIGDVRRTQGDLPGALRAYEDARAIRECFATAAPANAEWQRGLSIIRERIGDVRRAQAPHASPESSGR